MSHETQRSLEKDGFRALFSVDAGPVMLRSRRGTEMAASFPEIAAGAEQLPDATALDGELVVWNAAGRLAFERLQNRLARRGAGAARAAQEWPTHFVAFDLLRLSGTETNERVADPGRAEGAPSTSTKASCRRRSTISARALSPTIGETAETQRPRHRRGTVAGPGISVPRTNRRTRPGLPL
ncbi:ATP-dependent DNA ligase [Streptomyces griseofuscus]|uniref:ATP-dependent DNA ligase n=1 Tax=Streptomyces griseofuscus TaxID=146922 RepID=UPI0036998617